MTLEEQHTRAEKLLSGLPDGKLLGQMLALGEIPTVNELREGGLAAIPFNRRTRAKRRGNE